MSRVTKSSGPGVRYSPEFKESAVRLLESGRTLVSVSNELGVSIPTLISWKKKKTKGRGAVSPVSLVETDMRRADVHDEVRRLRAELSQVTEERDRLRRSLAVLIGLRPDE